MYRNPTNYTEADLQKFREMKRRAFLRRNLSLNRKERRRLRALTKKEE